MGDMARVRVAWQNWPGAPGVSTFYLTPAVTQTSIDAIRAFFNAQATNLPSGLTVTVPQTGDLIDDVSGLITGTWSVGTPPTVVTGSGAGAYAGNAGMVVHWLTGLVVNRRRVRGRTFLVPLISSCYDTAGSISAGTLTGVTSSASTLLAALGSNFRVWHRPAKGLGGGSGTVTSFRIPDLAVSLRSRRI